jgi:hypothetical protein
VEARENYEFFIHKGQFSRRYEAGAKWSFLPANYTAMQLRNLLHGRRHEISIKPEMEEEARRENFSNENWR